MGIDGRWEGKKETKGERGREERTETKGAGGEEGEGEGAGNDRTETEGWRGETFIRLSVCVSAGSLLFLSL